MKDDKKKEISSKMYSSHRCGKCNRFGHSHDKCTKEQLASKIDKFVAKNKEAGKNTRYMDTPSQEFPRKNPGIYDFTK